MTLARIDAIITFWFDGWDDVSPSPDCMKRWFGGGAALDDDIRTRFGGDHLAAARGELADWEATPRGTLALVLLLDQVPRNVYRGTAHAFATDALALSVSRRAVAEGRDEGLSLIQRQFLLMPFMHSESRETHAEARRHFGRLVELAAGAPGGLAGMLNSGLDYEVKHAAVIERFGRYPHRNECLGRESTPEERAFIAERGMGF